MKVPLHDSKTIYGPSMPDSGKPSHNRKADDWRQVDSGLVSANDQKFFNRMALMFILLVCGIFAGFALFRTNEVSYEINLFTELLGFLVAIGILEALNERRTIKFEKSLLLRQLRSEDKSLVKQALTVLKAHAWGFFDDEMLGGSYLEGASFEALSLRSINFANANLNTINLRKADLMDAIVTDASLADANLEEADLNGTDFENAYCAGAKFDNAKLRFANLVDADLRECSLKNVELTGADLRNQCCAEPICFKRL